MSQHDQVLRSLARLTSIRDTLPPEYYLSERWVLEYNEAISTAEVALGNKLDEFKVPPRELQPVAAGGNYITGEVTYRDGVWCERTVLLQRVTSVVNYLGSLLSQEPPSIGFR